MSSSTSSSSRGLRASLAIVALLLLVAELAVQGAEPRFSLDVDHIRQIPRILASMHAAPAPTVLFMGNSLTRRGVDPARMLEDLGPIGVRPEAVAAVYPDDTTMLDWLYLHEDAVVRRGANPSVIVLGFAMRHLADEAPRPTQTYRLGRHFTSWQSLPELFSTDVPELGDRMNVLLSKVSVLYANRERVSRRVLAFLPGYRPMAERVNDAIRDDRRPGADVAPTYARLERFLTRAAEHGTRVVVVAMPIRSGYDVDPALVDLLGTRGAVFVDARHIAGIDETHFLDHLHLNARGAELYSAYVAPVLAGYVGAR